MFNIVEWQKGGEDIREDQFANYIKKYERLIFTICLSFTKNYFDAEDLAQETFIAAYRNLNKFDGRNLKGWLTTIAANRCRNYLKKASTQNDIPTESDLECLEDQRGSPEAVVLEFDANQRVLRACKKLKEPYRTVAISYFHKDIKLSDMAKETGQNLKTLQTQLYRAKKLLKLVWEEESI